MNIVLHGVVDYKKSTA